MNFFCSRKYNKNKSDFFGVDNLDKNKNFRWDNFIFNLLIAEGGGFLSSLLSGNIGEKYNNLARPDFSAPGFIFPIVWVILYFLLALSNSLILNDKQANKLYFMSLLINFLWPIFFFGLELRLFAFVWLLFLIVLNIIIARRFFKESFVAGFLTLIYILWLVYAGYLNFGVWLLNK